MTLFNKKIMTILPLFFIIFVCNRKRDALGADNEIRVICSEIDRKNIELFLRSIFNDTLYTPEPEPFYFLKFSLTKLRITCIGLKALDIIVPVSIFLTVKISL